MRSTPGTLEALVERCAGDAGLSALASVETPEALSGALDRVPRAMLAHALNVLLYADLLQRVPSGAAYAGEQRIAGRRVVLDHGAVRTIAWSQLGALPSGIGQVTRVIEPLGFRRNETYPLTRIHMTGYSYTHLDLPDRIGQWFVSELHPDELSAAVQHGVERVFSSSIDPLDDYAGRCLATLADTGSLSFDEACGTLAVLVRCFARHHDLPTIEDYELFGSESAELAWIATEGTSFNHATDRVADVEAVAAGERTAGRPIKDSVEVSGSGRVRQTAHRATQVVRVLHTAEGVPVERLVPGSFFEFIERHHDGAQLDLGFDASNAQGIFAMTRRSEL